MNDDVILLAQTILSAAKLRKDSFDTKSAEKVQNAHSVINYNKFYDLTIKEASDIACEESGYDTRMTPFIELCLISNWNGMIDLASGIIEDINPEIDIMPDVDIIDS